MLYKEIDCPFCGEPASITYEECCFYQMACLHCHNTMFHQDASFSNAEKFFEHLSELVSADRENRCFTSPAAVGQAIFWVLKDEPWAYPETNGWYVSESHIECVATSGFFDDDGYDTFYEWDVLGREVFLNREAAEIAIAKKIGGNKDET